MKNINVYRFRCFFAGEACEFRVFGFMEQSLFSRFFSLGGVRKRNVRRWASGFVRFGVGLRGVGRSTQN